MHFHLKKQNIYCSKFEWTEKNPFVNLNCRKHTHTKTKRIAKHMIEELLVFLIAKKAILAILLICFLFLYS